MNVTTEEHAKVHAESIIRIQKDIRLTRVLYVYIDRNYSIRILVKILILIFMLYDIQKCGQGVWHAFTCERGQHDTTTHKRPSYTHWRIKSRSRYAFIWYMAHWSFAIATFPDPKWFITELSLAHVHRIVNRFESANEDIEVMTDVVGKTIDQVRTRLEDEFVSIPLLPFC